MQEPASPSLFSLLVVLIALLSIGVGGLAAVPAYILWKMKRDKRYPLAWVTCCALGVMIAAGLTYLQRPSFQMPTPVDQALAGVADKTGTLRVTAVRIPHPELPNALLELDVENTADAEQLLGMQYDADGGNIGNYSPGSSASFHIWTIPAKSRSTVSTTIKLPGFVQGGVINIVLARCNSTNTRGSWLPADSEALYQNRFVMIPAPEAP